MGQLTEQNLESENFIIAEHDPTTNSIYRFFWGANLIDYGEVKSSIDENSEITVKLTSHIFQNNQFYKLTENRESLIFNTTNFPDPEVKGSISSKIQTYSYQTDEMTDSRFQLV